MKQKNKMKTRNSMNKHKSFEPAPKRERGTDGYEKLDESISFLSTIGSESVNSLDSVKRSGIIFTSMSSPVIEDITNPIDYSLPIAIQASMNLELNSYDIIRHLRVRNSTIVTNIIINFIQNILKQIFDVIIFVDEYERSGNRTAIQAMINKDILSFESLVSLVYNDLSFDDDILFFLVSTTNKSKRITDTDINNTLVDFQRNSLGAIGILVGKLMNWISHVIVNQLDICFYDYGILLKSPLVSVFLNSFPEFKDMNRNVFLSFLLDFFTAQHQALIYIIHEELYHEIEEDVPVIIEISERISDKRKQRKRCDDEWE